MQESGPQLLLQLHIVLCTGNIGGSTQKISIIISFVSLTVASCRAFFVQRDTARADAEPTLHMMLRYTIKKDDQNAGYFFRVIPAMLLVLMYNIASWTITAGLLKQWTFLVLVIVFAFCYIVHKVLLLLKKHLYFVCLRFGTGRK